MTPRLYVDPRDAPAWAAGAEITLPPAAARHAQVLRLQPGAACTVFNGQGGQWAGEVLHMGRSEVRVRLVVHEPLERELPLRVTLAVCMPANDRMDDLVEKAVELGAAGIVPLVSERSVLRLSGERAQRRQAHWQSVATAACEQCGRNRPPRVHSVRALTSLLEQGLAEDTTAVTARWQLSLDPSAVAVRVALGEVSSKLAQGASAHILLLSGPEGGLSPGEQALAQAAGFRPVSLGPRVLRADTAPLAALAAVGAWCGTPQASA